MFLGYQRYQNDQTKQRPCRSYAEHLQDATPHDKPDDELIPEEIMEEDWVEDNGDDSDSDLI